ncbi:unnamed protein product [Rhizophagus irregularis]|nr:unnamed protein product [Rhizophagus irregularis]
MKLLNKLKLSCSLTTAKQTLYDAGIHSHVAAKKPFISKRHASARISWCEKYKEKTARDWAQVIFSDESSIEIGKHGQKSVIVWGCFAGGIKGSLVFCDENKERNEKINSNTYVRILNKHLHPFYHTVCELIRRAATFQQDNAPIHTVKITKDWLKKNKITIIDWPANFSDLNLIKNIWKQLKDNIQSWEVFPRTVGKLKAALNEE